MEVMEAERTSMLSSLTTMEALSKLSSLSWKPNESFDHLRCLHGSRSSMEASSTSVKASMEVL